MNWKLEVLQDNRLNDFVIICHDLWAEGQLDHLGFDRDTCWLLGWRCINDNKYFCQMAIDDNDKVVGCMVGYVTQLVFSNKSIGVEEGLFVYEGTPDRAAIAAEMLRRFVRFCKDAGVADVRTGVISNIDNYAADVFYRRNKFRRIGTIYSLRDPGEK